MRHLLIMFLMCSNALAQETDPMKAATQAISSIPEVKQKMKEWEKKLWYYLPLDKKSAAVVGGVANTLVQGRVSTKDIKNMNMDFFGGKVRADVQYDFKNDTTESYVNCKWDL